VVGKYAYVVDPMGTTRTRGGSANAARERDAQAAVPPLVRTDHEKLGPGNAVEAGPIVVVERDVELADDGRERRNPVVLALEQDIEAGAHFGVAFSTRHRLTTYRILYPMRRKSPPPLQPPRKSKAPDGKTGKTSAIPAAQDGAQPSTQSMAPKHGEARRGDTIHVQSEWLEAGEQPLVLSIPFIPIAPGVPRLTNRPRAAKAPPPLPPESGHATRPSRREAHGKSARPPKHATAKVRAMQDEDLPLVRQLNFQLGYSGTIKQIRARFVGVREQPGQELFVALVGERLVGWLHVQSHRSLESEPYAEIAGLIVDRNERRHGVGRALVERACAWAKEQQHATVRVRSDVQREEAAKFYPALGFEILKTQHNYSLDITSDSL
jgi:GNAT superfamily N-acetyltransferase